MGHKIATCSYCGTRAALIFDEGQHELVCRAGGAPLHEIKSMPQGPDRKKKKYAPGAAEKQRMRREAEAEVRGERCARPAHQRSRKPRKTFGRRVFEEVWDVVEDIFD